MTFFSFSRINRGNEMLIAFHSSPYSAPLQTGTPNRGFELNVDILFTDSDSYDFVEAQKCEFHINASSPGEFVCFPLETERTQDRWRHEVETFTLRLMVYMQGIINFVFAFPSFDFTLSCIHKMNECFTSRSRAIYLSLAIVAL